MNSPQLLVLSVAHDVADARIHRLVDRSLQRGFKVDVWARGKAADAPSGARAHILTQRFRIARLFRVVRPQGRTCWWSWTLISFLSLLPLVGHVERELWCAMFMRITAL